MRFFIILFTAFFAFVAPALPQQVDEEEREGLLAFIEDKLSADNRIIRLNGLEGTLSSNVELDSITVADEDGIYLTIVEPRLVWSRRALLLGRVEIEELTAQAIDFPRLPKPDESLPDAEATPFALPDLPVSIRVDKLSVGSAKFGEPVFGLEAEASLDGSIRLADGTLDAKLDAKRLDKGGSLTLAATFGGEPAELDLDLVLEEPADGIVANLANLEGKPPVRVAVTGKGPVSDLDVTLDFTADGTPVVGGSLKLAETAQGLGITTRLSGPLVRVLPEEQRAFFGENSRVEADAVLREGGGLTLERILLDSGSLQAVGSARTTKDNFLSALNLDFRLVPTDGARVTLPGSAPAEQRPSLGGASAKITYDAAAQDGWTAAITTTAVRAGGLDIGEVKLLGEGEVNNLNNATERRATFLLSGNVADITAEDPAVQEALGETLDFVTEGKWKATEPLVLDRLVFLGKTFRLNAGGTLADLIFDGSALLDAKDLSAFSSLAGRDLAGAIRLLADGRIEPLSGAFDLALDGTKGDDLETGIEQVDALLAGRTVITGAVKRDETGLTFREVTVANEQVRANLDGRYASDVSNLKATARLADARLVTPQAEGPVVLDVSLDGQQKPFDLVASVRMERGELTGRVVRNLTLKFDGVTNLEGVDGALTADGELGGGPVAVEADIDVTSKVQSVQNVDARIGATRLTGNIERGENGLIDGALTVASSDIGDVAALALVDASGSVNGTVTLTGGSGTQDGSADLAIANIRYGENTVDAGDLNARFTDLFGRPKVDAELEASGIRAGGVVVRNVDADISTQGDDTTFDLDAQLADQDARIQTSGVAVRDGSATRVTVERLQLDSAITAARLAEPTTITLDGGVTQIEETRLVVGSGAITLSGSVGETLDLVVDANDLPLAIANAVAPDLDLSGTLSAEAQVQGTTASPQVTFDINGSAIGARALRNAGVEPINVEARGAFADNVVRLENASIRNGQGIAVDASGRIPVTAAAGEMDVDVRVNNLPLAAANTVAPDLGLAGSLTANAQVSGTFAAPRATFDLSGTGVDAAPLRNAGVQPVDVAANGSFADNTLQLASASVRNGQGIAIDASGRVPLSGGGLNVNVDGTAPLDLAESFLATRGTQVSGTARVNATATGSISDPQINGLASVSNATIFDPLSNVRLENVGLMAGLNGDRATIQRFNGNLSTGGSVAVSGSVGLSNGLPADLRVQLRDARYTDGQTFSATASGDLALTGQIAVSPLLSGEVVLDRVEVLVPESFGGANDLLDVVHVNPPPKVRRTLNRLERASPTPTPTSRPVILRLDILVRAPARIFVRGRGLDAELGGQVRVRGPVNDIRPVGSFTLRRGRLSLLGRRIVLDEGSITLTGNLNPRLDFVARTQAGDVTAFIRIFGRTSDLDVEFSSDPSLPDDEVLARVVFGREIGALSPFQIAQLAAAAAELTGGNSPGLVSGLRSGTGLDDLDVVTDGDGNAAVAAGKYISDNVYLGVQAGSTSKATINLDITDDLTARGTVGSDGESEIGIFFEKDY